MPGFVFPNEVAIEWDLLITIYPYITGLVAGAFIVSSLYHVFNMTKLKAVARLSLITALAFLLITPLPLTVHLGRPERALEMLLTPNLRSAMAGFGYIWFSYLLLVMAEIWLVYRADIVKLARVTSGIKRIIYSILTLGIRDLSEESIAADKRRVKVLALLGIPVAFLLHGYVGFIFGAVKANPWWSTPLMPIIFIMSATVSGIALLIVIQVITTRMRKEPLDHDCLQSLSLWLLGFLSVNVVLEVLEVFTMFYESEESWGIISQLITQKIPFSYFGLQLIAGALIPLFTLIATAALPLSKKVKGSMVFISSMLVLIGVFAMRWNVVIGGQLMSKSLRGFTSFTPPLFGSNGILTAGIILLLPFVILIILAYLLPPWHQEIKSGIRPPAIRTARKLSY